MAIRAMRLADVDAVYAIAKRQFERCWSKQQFVQEVVHPQGRHWVAEHEGCIWAYICIRVCVPEAEIFTLATHPDHARRGLASQLLDHALREACAEGCRRMYLEVRVSNRPAHSLYLAAGFERVAVRKRYYPHNGEDAQVFARDLGGA